MFIVFQPLLGYCGAEWGWIETIKSTNDGVDRLKTNTTRSNYKNSVAIKNITRPICDDRESKDISPSKVYNDKDIKYYYFNNFGYINLNKTIRVNLDKKYSYDYLISNIHLDNQKITYSPILFSSKHDKISYNMPKEVLFSILWEKESFFSYYKPIGKIEQNNFYELSTVYLLKKEEFQNYQLLLKSFSNIDSKDFTMEKLFGDKWNHFVQSFNHYSPTIQKIGINNKTCTFYIRNNEGNSIIVNNNYILSRCDNHWNLKHVMYRKMMNNEDCEIIPEKQQTLYFFFPDECSVTQKCNHYYKNNKHFKYLKTNVYNSNQNIFEILPSSNKDIQPMMYMASTFDPLKSIKINCTIVVEESNFANNTTFNNFKKTQIFKNILDRHESLMLIGKKIYNSKKPDGDRKKDQTTHIIDAMKSFELYASKVKNQQLHFFLTQCPYGGFSDNEINRFSNQLRILNFTHIVVWEFQNYKQPGETVYQYLFKKVTANCNCKYKHHIITSKEYFNNIIVPDCQQSCSNTSLFSISTSDLNKNNSVWMNSFKDEDNATRYYFITKNQKLINKNVLEIQLILYSSYRGKYEKFWEYTNNKFSTLIMRAKKNSGMNYQYRPSQCKDCNRVKNFYKLFIWSKTNLPEKIEDIKFVLMPVVHNLPAINGFDKISLNNIKLCYSSDSKLMPYRYSNVCDEILYDKNGFAYIQYCGNNKNICIKN